MKRIAFSTFIVTAASGALHASANYSSHDVERLRKAQEFSGIISDAGCLANEGVSFVRVYSARDPEPFLKLAAGPTPAAKLFALCGLQHLNVPEAAELRARLSSSTEKTRLHMGCVVSPPTQVREFFRSANASGRTALDQACEILLRHDPARLSVTACDRNSFGSAFQRKAGKDRAVLSQSQAAGHNGATHPHVPDAGSRHR